MEDYPFKELETMITDFFYFWVSYPLKLNNANTICSLLMECANDLHMKSLNNGQKLTKGRRELNDFRFFAAIYDDGRNRRWEMLTLDVLSPLMLVLLRSPQQFLNVLGDLLCFTDDVFSAGQTGVGLTFVIIQLGYRAALPHPAAAAQTTSTAKAARREEVI